MSETRGLSPPKLSSGVLLTIEDVNYVPEWRGERDIAQNTPPPQIDHMPALTQQRVKG